MAKATRRSRRGSAPPIPSTTRTVSFYRLVGPSTDGRAPYPVVDAFRLVNALPFDATGRYQEGGTEGAVAMWIDQLDPPRPIHVRFGNVRRQLLPQVERHGVLKPLALADDEGLADMTPFVVFDKGIVGVLSDPHGPRITRLPAYLVDKCPTLVPAPMLGALLRSDVASQLRRLTEIRLVDIEVRQSDMAAVQQANKSLGDALEAASDLTNPDVVRLVMKAERTNRSGLGQKARDLVLNLVSSSGASGLMRRFVVRGADPVANGGVVEVDVLRQHIVAKEQVVFRDRRSRVLDHVSCYQAILKARLELKDEIDRAATAVVV